MDMMGIQSWQQVNQINYKVLGGVVVSGTNYDWGTPNTHRVSGLNLTMHGTSRCLSDILKMKCIRVSVIQDGTSITSNMARS